MDSTTLDSILTCMKKTRVNTLPMCACLEACLEEAPYREIEDSLADLPVMHRSIQTPHTLIDLLVKAGAIERIEVPEEEAAEEESAGAIDIDEAADGESSETDTTDEAVDQPIDYLLKTTEEGRAALEEFSCEKLFTKLLAQEPSGFHDAYYTVLKTCEPGARLDDVKQAFGTVKVDAPADPERGFEAKSVYPEYFISKLEATGAIQWNKRWEITESGQRILASYTEGSS